MKNLIVEEVKSEDYKILESIYGSAFSSAGERRTPEALEELMQYFSRDEIQLKLVLEGKIIGGFFAQVKPRIQEKYLFDPELFLDSEYHKRGYGRYFLRESLKYAKEKFGTETVYGIADKNHFPIQRYKRTGRRTVKNFELIKGEVSKITEQLQ